MRPSLFLLLVLAVLLPASRAGAADFEPLLLSVGEGRVRGVRARDLTGDGMREIVAFSDGPAGTAVSVFVPDARGRYPSEPTVAIPLADRGVLDLYYATVVRIGRERPAEILLVDRRRGLLLLGLVRDDGGAWTATAVRAVGDAPPLPFPPDEERITVLDVGEDLDGDGAEELLLPASEGFVLTRFGPEGAPAGRELLPVRTRLTAEEGEHRFMTLAWELPRLTAADWDGDGLVDLVGGLSGRLVLFLQTRTGGFFAVEQSLDLLDEARGDGRKTGIALGDVNRDGRLDLVVARHAARLDPLDRFRTTFGLYLNPRILSPDEGRLTTPAGALSVDGVGVNPTLIDFDDDGYLDLLVTALDISPGSRLRKQIGAEYRLHRFDPETNRFEEDPYFAVRRPFPVDQLERESTAPVCFFAGDFDGDGRRDLLDIAADGGLSILPGTKDTGIFSTARYAFEDEAIFRAKARVENDVLVTRLGGRASTDAIAFRGDRVYVIRRAP